MSDAAIDALDLPVTSLDGPRHPYLQQLYAHWLVKRGAKRMPSRADIVPAEIKPVLSDLIIWNAAPPYTIRLVGDHIVRFVGSNNTGLPATQEMPPEAGRVLIAVLTAVIESRSPRFRTGKAFWKPEHAYRDFESCFLPLSNDGQKVDMILGGLKYDIEGYVA
ncbi:MAG TPA: PAS domain-containing protein [Rhizomicrobium sp.]|nr:PAS domain-containing protein [Rhizomicrobium sp.]